MSERGSHFDGFSPEEKAAIRAYAKKIVAEAPPLTEEQKQLIKRMFGPYLRPKTKPGDAA